MPRRISFSTLVLAMTLGIAGSAFAGGCQSKPEIDPAEAAAQLEKDIESARVLVKDGHNEKALAVIKKIRELEPDNPDAHYLVGRIAYDEENYERALPLLQKGAAGRPDDAEYQFYVGECLRLMKRHAEAGAAYAKAAELDPESGDYALWHGKMLKETEKYAEAEKIFRHVVEIDEQAIFVYTELGDALLAQDKVDEALVTYMKAQNIHPGDKTAHAGAAFAYEKKGDLSHALDEWSAYVRMDCCSDFSKNVAKKKLDELTARSQAGDGAEEAG